MAADGPLFKGLDPAALAEVRLPAALLRDHEFVAEGALLAPTEVVRLLVVMKPSLT